MAVLDTHVIVVLSVSVSVPAAEAAAGRILLTAAPRELVTASRITRAWGAKARLGEPRLHRHPGPSAASKRTRTKTRQQQQCWALGRLTGGDRSGRPRGVHHGTRTLHPKKRQPHNHGMIVTPTCMVAVPLRPSQIPQPCLVERC